MVCTCVHASHLSDVPYTCPVRVVQGINDHSFGRVMNHTATRAVGRQNGWNALILRVSNCHHCSGTQLAILLDCSDTIADNATVGAASREVALLVTPHDCGRAGGRGMHSPCALLLARSDWRYGAVVMRALGFRLGMFGLEQQQLCVACWVSFRLDTGREGSATTSLAQWCPTSLGRPPTRDVRQQLCLFEKGAHIPRLVAADATASIPTS
jgi:hypothetical protein